MNLSRYYIGVLGLLAVITLIATLLIFGFLNADFSFLDDFISKLGARGEPNALLFNLIGFLLVGLLLFVFGLSYGRLLHDKLLAVLLSLFGLGFAFTAVPIDMEYDRTAVSKIHIVSICLGLAFWLFGLSRLGYNMNLDKYIRNRANFTAVILVLSMMGFVFGLWSMPITHRLVFMIVFGWTAITSIDLISNESKHDRHVDHNDSKLSEG